MAEAADVEQRRASSAVAEYGFSAAVRTRKLSVIGV